MSAPVAGPPRAFELDRFQIEAIAHVEASKSVVVAAPTGSGKTYVAQHALALARSRGRRGLYTTPIKALSNQKYRDLCNWLGADEVGLLTGDNSIHRDASTVVMTTEVLRNMLYAEPERLETTDVVVMDEVHYLQDNFRGQVWEEVIIHLPSHIRLIALSATVSNASELADWISEVHGPCEAVTETTRPIELENTYFVAEKGRSRLHFIPTLLKGRPNPDGRSFDSMRGRNRHSKRRNDQGRPRSTSRTPRRVEVIEELDRRNLLPAITFIFSRAGCEEAVVALRRAELTLVGDQDADRIGQIAEARTGHLNEADRKALGHAAWLDGLRMGVAAHHAGVVPIFKETVEELFTLGLLRAVFATETLALGINMPARSVVIEKLSKFTGEHHEALTAADYTQLTGRAGRRGIDDFGHAVVLWTPFTTFDEVVSLARSQAFELRSSFRPTYNMTCHLVSRYTRKEAETLVARSFGQFQANREVADLAARRDRLRATIGQPEIVERLPSDLIDAVMAKLRPGDAVDVAGIVAVIAVSWRRKTLQVRVLDRDGEVHTLDPSALRSAPVVVASLNLPESFNPHNESHQHDLVGQLRTIRRGASTKNTSAEPTPPEALRRPWSGSGDSAQLKELRRVEARISERKGRLNDRFKAVVGLLSELSYIERWQLTERGKILLGTFHELDLALVETLLDGHLDNHDPATLAGLVSMFVYEPRGHDEADDVWFPNRETHKAATGIDRCVARVRRMESAYGLPESRDVDAGLFAATHGWTAGESLSDLLDPQTLSGGDFVRAMKRVADLLSQVAVVAPSAATRRSARVAIDGIQRGIVDAPFDPAAHVETNEVDPTE